MDFSPKSIYSIFTRAADQAFRLEGLQFLLSLHQVRLGLLFDATHPLLEQGLSFVLIATVGADGVQVNGY